MKNLIILLSVVFIYGCEKNNPKPGKYVGEFIYTYPNPDSLDETNITEWYIIKDVGKDYMQITRSNSNGGVESIPSTLDKDNKKITGILPSISPSGNREIEGTWERKKGKCIIKGTFTQSGASPNGRPIR